jgi:hypothetical protein
LIEGIGVKPNWAKQVRCGARFMPPALLIGGFFVVSAGATGQNPLPNAPTNVSKSTFDFSYDFRDKDSLDANFKLIGRDAGSRIKHEPEGLRISLPGEQRTPDPLGVAPKFPIQGDFEITVGYEIMHAVSPADSMRELRIKLVMNTLVSQAVAPMGIGAPAWPQALGALSATLLYGIQPVVGVGFEIYLEATGAGNEGLILTHVVRPDGANAFKSTRRTNIAKGKRGDAPGIILDEMPATGNSGRLRLTRVGPKMMVSTSASVNEEFRAVHRFDLNTNDIWMFRMGPYPRERMNPVEVRLHDLVVRTSDIHPFADDAQKRGALWRLAGLFAAGLVIGGCWLWWHRTRAAPRTQIPQSNHSAK